MKAFEGRRTGSRALKATTTLYFESIAAVVENQRDVGDEKEHQDSFEESPIVAEKLLGIGEAESIISLLDDEEENQEGRIYPSRIEGQPKKFFEGKKSKLKRFKSD